MFIQSVCKIYLSKICLFHYQYKQISLYNFHIYTFALYLKKYTLHQITLVSLVSYITSLKS